MIGGIALTGMIRNDGTGYTQFGVNGDALITGTITADKLQANSITTDQLTTNRLIVNKHIWEGAVSQISPGGGFGVAYAGLTFRGTGGAIVTAVYAGYGAAYNAVDQFDLRIYDNTTGGELTRSPINQSQSGSGGGSFSKYGSTTATWTGPVPEGPRAFRAEIVRTVFGVGVDIGGLTMWVAELSK